MQQLPVNYENIQKAHMNLNSVSTKTPVIQSQYLNDLLKTQLYIKCENLQKTGSFKFRGAYNSLSNLTKEQQKDGVITFSSGNHAQAIALSGNLLNIETTIIMPEDAPQIKINSTKEYGGNIILYNRYKEDRVQVAQKYQKKQTLIPPFNHIDVIAGQGTVAKELIEEVGYLDFLFVCLGGGGLISGCSIAAKHLSKNCKIIGVEPETGNDAQMSIQKGEIVTINVPDTIADGAQTTALGEITFQIIKKNVDEIITVSDQQLINCMKICAEKLKIIVEPTGCLGLAGAIYSGIQFKQQDKIGIIISGGNIDLDRYFKLINLK